MALKPTEFAAREGERIEFRTDPLRVRIELSDLVSADKHDLRCVFEFSARVGDHASDRQLFAEVLMAGRPAVQREDVAIHLRPTLESSAVPAAAQPIADLLTESAKAALTEALRKAADAEAFNSGLIILPPFQLELTSPSLQRQQREAAQRSRAEEQAAGRLQHLRQATELLKQFDSIRAAAPSISAGQVLERIAPPDRGALLDALLAGNADRATSSILYAVAGTQLVRIDLSGESIQPVAIELPTTLGPLRSVQPAQIDTDSRLLIGARGGILLVDPGNPKAAVAYADPALNSSLGFNRAIHLAGSNSILGTHGEAGLVQWDIASPKEPVARMRAADLLAEGSGSVRNIQPITRTAAICSIGNALVFVDGSVRSILAGESSSAIVTILNAGNRQFVIHEDGLVSTLDRETRKFIRSDRHGGDISAAAALPWLDGHRLLLACASGAIDCVGTDDSLVTRFNSAYRGLRTLAAGSNWVAGVSPDRQRLIIWKSWDGRSPAHDLHLISLTKHRIADIAFL
jgi:hypothetical protein